MKTKIKTSLVALVTALQMLVLPIASADFLPDRAYGNDTVAGYASLLKSSMINPGQNVVFVIEKPDMSVVRVPAQADLEGIAKADLYGHQTKIAGDYKVAMIYSGLSSSTPQNSFVVYPDAVSVTQSDITSTDQMITADGEEKTFVTVTLFDTYRNPINNHQIKLISSRQEDEVTPLNDGVTDENGRANFKVTSKYSGISVFTAMDLTLNNVLAEREEIAFFAPTKPEPIGGTYFSANLFNADITSSDSSEVLPGPVDHFEIENIPSTIKVNADQTLTIVAKDKDGNVAKNYTGTVLISTPDDEHAILPNNGEYAFKESNQGQFTFNLALRFTKIGNQTIQILDKSNWKIAGEFQTEVVPEKAIVTPDVSSSLSIKSPVDGAELGNSLLVITGQGDPNINLKVFDNDIKIGNSETDSDGFFSFQAQNLISGPHSFYAMSDNGDVSKSVTVQIDTLPPVLNSFTIDPDGNVKPGEALSITVQSEPSLDSVKVRIQGIEEQLMPAGDPGTYSAVVAAPVVTGTFPIDVMLVDSLSNKAELLGRGSVSVTAEVEVNPPKVEGLEGIAGDAKIELAWNEITSHKNEIQKYRIYYGEVFDSLDKSLDTTDDTASTIIENLENNKQYFFAVTAVDSKGLESEEKSVTIAVTPVGEQVEAPVVEPPLNGVDPITGQITDPTDTQTSNLPGTVQGTSTPNTVTLGWQPFAGITAYYYKVYFGIQSGRYDDYVVTPDNKPNLVIKDLINGIPYYFSVVALDITGREISPLSSEIVMVPNGGGLHSAPSIAPPSNDSYHSAPLDNAQLTKVPNTEKTGPETIWIILISLFVASVLYNNKKKFIKS